MFKKALIALGLLGVTTLSGCVVVAPHRPYAYAGPCYVAPCPGPVVVAPVVVAPVVPIFGFYGGGYYHGYRGGGHWR